MKSVMKIAVFASTLAFLNACGASEEKKEQSEVAGLFSTSKVDFNLGKYIENEAAKNGLKLPKMVVANSNGLGVGGQKSFLATNNIIYKSEEQKVSAQYYLDVLVLKQKVTGGHVIDLVARAQTDRPEAEYDIRIAGDSKVGSKFSSLKTLKYSRVILGVTMPFGIIPGLQLDLGGKLGGELAFSIAPNINIRNKTAEIIMTPSLGLYGTVDTGISVLFAKAGARGTVNVLNGKMPVSGGLSFAQNKVKPTLRVEPLKLNLLEGKADLYASLSIGNVLPGPAKSLWQSIFGNGLEYTYPLLRWDGFDILATKGYSLAAK